VDELTRQYPPEEVGCTQRPGRGYWRQVGPYGAPRRATRPVPRSVAWHLVFYTGELGSDLAGAGVLEVVQDG
jgi:hypothetical protein